MNTDLLKYFFTVARFMNVTKAAEYLYMTQPTLSKRIIALEDELGVKLFLRRGRKLELTEAGRIVLQDGSEIDRRITELEGKLDRLSHGIVGKLLIEAEPQYNDRVFRLYREYRVSYPEVTLNVRHSHYDAIVEKLDRGETDIGVLRSFELGFLKATGQYEFKHLYRDASCLCVADDHRLAGRESVKLRDLAGERFTCLQRMARANHFQKFIEKAGGTLSDDLPPTFNDMIQEIRNGESIAFVEKGIPPDNYIGCTLLDVQDAELSHEIVMAWNKKNPNPALAAFLRMLRTAFGAAS